MKGPIIFLGVFVGAILIFLIVAKVSSLKQYNLITRTGSFRIIDRLLIILSIAGILTTLLCDFNYLRYKSPILHENWQSILLKDFRGLKMPKDNLDGETKFAFVSSSIRIKNNRNLIKIETLFHPCRSYVYNRKLFADGLLTHEMYHFHITEYCARLMRKDVQESINDNRPIHLNAIRMRYLQEERELQYQYDDETYHSYVHGKQLEWQEKVDSLLLSVVEYSNTIISLGN